MDSDGAHGNRLRWVVTGNVLELSRNATGIQFVDYESQLESVHANSALCARSHSDYTINQRITISTVGRPPLYNIGKLDIQVDSHGAR